MKIAFLTPEYPHPKVKHAAGIGTSIKNLATALAAQGEQIYVFVYGQDTTEVVEDQGVILYLIQDKNYKFGKWFFYRKHIEKFVNNVIKQTGIELLEAPDWTGITAFMNFHVPLIIRLHGSDTYFCHLENRKQKWKNKWFEKVAFKKAKGFLAPTDFAGKLTSDLFEIPLKKVKTIHNGLELDKFENTSPDQYEEGLLLYIGTIIRKKGVLELPEIFNKVRNQFPKARLVLIGGDSNDVITGRSTWELTESLLHENDKAFVTYLGKIPYNQVKEYIKKAHICVFPTFAETLGMVTIESMAMQKAVVNSSIGWSQELMEDGKSGFLVHPADHQAFADAIVSLLQDQSLVKNVGVQARRYVENHFDIEQIVSLNVQYYTEIIKGC